MTEILSKLSSIIWGPYVLVPLLLLTGIYLTILLKGIQFRELGPSLHLARIKRREETSEGDISHYQALMTALAATVGTGNIVGVATAIALGGPGALFWMWMTALFGMATKYSEALLGVKYRHTDAAGERSGGPAFYLTNGIGGGLGRGLGILFAVFAAIAAFGIGNMVQSNATTSAINTAFGIPNWISGLVLTLLAASVILGGIRSIGRVTGFFVPFMAIVYVLGATIVLIFNAAEIPGAIGLVISSAFTGQAAAGGFAGADILAGIQFGVARGIFSNESGPGPAASPRRRPRPPGAAGDGLHYPDVYRHDRDLLLHRARDRHHRPWRSGGDGGAFTQRAFETAFGSAGPTVVAIGLALFAFSTLLGWAYYGERNLEYLFGSGAVFPYRLIFIVAIFIGSTLTLEGVFLFADVANGLMTLPNLIGLLLLSGIVVRETRSYFNGSDRREPRDR